MKSILKKLALLIPAVRRLHGQRNQLLSETERLTAKNQAYESQLSQLSRESAGLREQINGFASEIEALRSEKTQLTVENQAQRSDIARLGEENALLRDRIHALGRDIHTITKEKHELQSRTSALEEQNRAMREDVERAAKENQALIALVKDYGREHENLKSQAAQAQSAVASASAIVPPYLLYRQRNIERITQRSREAKAYAIICSMGRTATAWICNAFNLHPRIFFSHGPDLEPTKRQKTKRETREGSPRIFQQMTEFDPLDIDAYFDLLESRGEYAVYGNVHGLALTKIPESPGTNRRSYYACAMFRHPILRLQSFVNKWSSFLRPGDPRGAFLELEKFHTSEEAKRLAKTYGLGQFNDHDILFAKALATLLFYDRHYFVLGIPLFQMERLVSDIEYFLGLFHDATAGLVEPTDKYLNALRRLKPYDQLRDDSVAARSVFRSWDEWKRTFFLDELHKSDMLGTYEILGYNLRACVQSPNGTVRT